VLPDGYDREERRRQKSAGTGWGRQGSSDYLRRENEQATAEWAPWKRRRRTGGRRDAGSSGVLPPSAPMPYR